MGVGGLETSGVGPRGIDIAQYQRLELRVQGQSMHGLEGRACVVGVEEEMGASAKILFLPFGGPNLIAGTVGVIVGAKVTFLSAGAFGLAFSADLGSPRRGAGTTAVPERGVCHLDNSSSQVSSTEKTSNPSSFATAANPTKLLWSGRALSRHS